MELRTIDLSMSGRGRQLLRLLVPCSLWACAPPSAAVPANVASELAVYVEGLCPKLQVYGVGGRAYLAYGTYGLDAEPFSLGTKQPSAVVAKQAFVGLARGSLGPASMVGLPLTLDGYVPGDVEIGGRWPEAVWLARIETRRGSSARVLFQRSPVYYALEAGAWHERDNARDLAMTGVLPPRLPREELCPDRARGVTFAGYAAERTPEGRSLVAGRCQDKQQRARGGVRLAVFEVGAAAWQVVDAPPAPLFDSIVNLGVVLGREALLYAYPPYQVGRSPAYLARLGPSGWVVEPVPFVGPIVSLAADGDTLWAVAGWSELWRRRAGKWSRVPLPPPAFVEPVPPLRLLQVQVVDGDVWLHAAYPVELARAGKVDRSRGHVLFSSRKRSPLYCDRRAPASQALMPRPAAKLRGAQTVREGAPASTEPSF